MCVGDYMQKEDNKKNKCFRKYIYIIALLGIFIDQVVKLGIKYLFNQSLCNIVCITTPCPGDCLSNLISTGGTYHGLNVLPNKGIEIIKNFFYIIEVKNTGGAWGMFSGNVPILALISAFVVVLLYFFLKSEKNLTKLSITYYGLLFAGIIGNLIDRLINGYVIDFLNFYIFGYDYPVFNIADIFIVIGIGLMVIDVVRGEIHAFKERKRKC